MNMPQSLGNQPLPLEPPSLSAPVEGPGATSPPEHCWPVRPTLRNELDTFSVHFYIFFGPSVALPPERPAVFGLRLLPVLDSGGVLSLELHLNAVLCGEGEVAPMGELEKEGDRCGRLCRLLSLDFKIRDLVSSILVNKHALGIDSTANGLGQPGNSEWSRFPQFCS